MKNKTSNNKKTEGKLSAPVATTKVVRAKTPSMRNTTDGNMIISHTEYCSDLYGTLSSPASAAVTLNPQDASTFPWLSAIASRFEMYRFKKLKFHYNPSCPTSTEGYMILAFDFDAQDEIPTAKTELLTWKYAMKIAPWAPLTLDVSKDARLSTARYCQPSPRNISGVDNRLDALGNAIFNAGFNSISASLGEIMIEYTVELMIPSYRAPPALYAKVVGTPSGAAFTFPTFVIDTLTNVLLSRVSNNVLRLETPGSYQLTYDVGGTGFTGPAGLTVAADLAAPESTFVDYGSLANAFSSTSAINTTAFRLINGAVTISLPPPPGAATLTRAILRLGTYALTS